MEKGIKKFSFIFAILLAIASLFGWTPRYHQGFISHSHLKPRKERRKSPKRIVSHKGEEEQSIMDDVETKASIKHASVTDTDSSESEEIDQKDSNESESQYDTFNVPPPVKAEVDNIENVLGSHEIVNPLKTTTELLFPSEEIEKVIKATEGKGLRFVDMCASDVEVNHNSSKISSDGKKTELIDTQSLVDFRNIEIPFKSFALDYSQGFFRFAREMLEQHGVPSTHSIISMVRNFYCARPPEKVNPKNYVQMLDEKILAGFTSPIRLVTAKKTINKMEWTMAPILDKATAEMINFKPIGFKEVSSLDRTKEQIRKLFLKQGMNDIGIASIRTELNWDKTDMKKQGTITPSKEGVDLKHFDFENFFVDTEAISFPFAFKLGALSKHLWNRSLFLLMLQQAVISLKQKYTLMKQIRKLNKKNHDISFDAEKNEYYVEIEQPYTELKGDKRITKTRRQRKTLLSLESGVLRSDVTSTPIYFGSTKFTKNMEEISVEIKKRAERSMRSEYTTYIEEDKRILEKFHLPPKTSLISIEYGNLQVVVLEAPHSDSYNYAFNVLDSSIAASRIVKNLGCFIIKKNKLAEILQNSVLLFSYSLFINEACAEFPAFLLYGLSPTPEYANELSCLWMVQNSSKGIYEKYLDLMNEKFEEPMKPIHAIKRLFSALRVRSTSDDVYFSEIAFARPELKGEFYFMEAIKKMRQDSGTTSHAVMENYKQLKHYFDAVPPVTPSDDSIRDIDMKSSVSDFTGPNSSAMTRYKQQISKTVYIVESMNYCSSGTMTALASGASSKLQGCPPNILENRKKAVDKFKEETSSELLETSVYNLCVQSIGEPDETTVFVKSQTQGVRGITVTKPNTKFKTQFAESLVRPLCHEEKENLILDVEKRAERIIEMTKNVRLQKNKLSNSYVVSFAIDLKNFNTFICLDFMAEIVGEKMMKAGYSKKSIESYRELILSYKEKKIQIKLASIMHYYEAWRYTYHKEGHYQTKMNKLKTKIKNEPLQARKEHVEQRILKLERKTKKLMDECDKGLFPSFEDIHRSKNHPLKGENFAIVLDQEWGMFQGILGCSATLMMTEIYKTFLFNYKYVCNKNFDFICMSDDANIVVELDKKCSPEQFLNDLNNFMMLFGPRLNIMKCGSSETTDIWFNSNKWSPFDVSDDSFMDYYRLTHFHDDDVQYTIVNQLFNKEKMVETRHLSRYLKLFFKDDLSVNYQDELHTKTSNYQYLLPFYKLSASTSCIQTMTSLSSYLIRSTPLFMDTMRLADPEQCYFFPVAIPIGPDCFSSPVFSKLIRNEYTNLVNDRRRGLRYLYPEYSSVRKAERFSDTLKKVVSDKTSLMERVDMCDFISSIVKAGDAEDRSPELLLKTLYQPFYIVKTGNSSLAGRMMGKSKSIYPMKKYLIENVDFEVCSMYYLFLSLREQDQLDKLRYFNFGKKSQFEPPSFTELEYMLKGTSMTVDIEKYISEASLFESKKEIEIPFPSTDFFGFNPDVLKNGDRVSTILVNPVAPSTWSCPQESRGKAWIHEGLYIKEFYTELNRKHRFIFSVLDRNIISANIMEFKRDTGIKSFNILHDDKMDFIVESWRTNYSVLSDYTRLPEITQENLWMSEYYWYNDRFVTSLKKRKERLLTTTMTARRKYVNKLDDKGLSDYEKQVKYGHESEWKDESVDEED